MKAAVPLRLPHTVAAVAAVAAGGSAACAAQALHVSPSAVTRAVQQAEALLGLPLFARLARAVRAVGHGRAR